MNTALPAVPAILTPLHGLLRWLMPATSARRKSSTTRSRRGLAMPLAANHDDSAKTERRMASGTTSQRPLRVVRILEAGQTHGQPGRMRISGRMADVCAELDRLAASEAKLH